MESGKIVLEGSETVMADQAVIDSYLGQVQVAVCDE